VANININASLREPRNERGGSVVDREIYSSLSRHSSRWSRVSSLELCDNTCYGVARFYRADLHAERPRARERRVIVTPLGIRAAYRAAIGFYGTRYIINAIVFQHYLAQVSSSIPRRMAAVYVLTKWGIRGNVRAPGRDVKHILYTAQLRS